MFRPTEINLHISGYSSARGILCACVFIVIDVVAYSQVVAKIISWRLAPTCPNCLAHDYLLYPPADNLKETSLLPKTMSPIAVRLLPVIGEV